MSSENTNQAEPNSDCCLHIGHLSRGVTRNDLLREFSRVAEVIEVKIMKHAGTSSPVGYGFVTLSTHEGALRCLEQLEDITIRGRKISLSWAQRKKPNVDGGIDGLAKSATPMKHMKTITSIHVSFESTKSGIMIDEAYLSAVYSAYGNVIDVSMKERHLNKGTNLYHGLAFVHYEDTKEGIEAAFRAANDTRCATINDVKYSAEPSKYFLQFLASQDDSVAYMIISETNYAKDVKIEDINIISYKIISGLDFQKYFGAGSESNVIDFDFLTY